MRAEQYLAPETLGQLAPFELRAKMIVEGVMSGMHRSPYQGLAVEFAEHRQYVKGDPVRHLDWKVFGRSDKLYLKRYVQETNLDVVVLIDTSASMRFGSLAIKEGWGGTQAGRVGGVPAKWTKFDHATAVAAAMAYLCLQQRDRVGVGTFAEELRTIMKRSNARDQWRLVVQALSTEPVDGKANLPKVAEQALSKVLNRALIVIVSDFLMPTVQIREALARFRYRHHDVVLLQVLDRQEMRFDLADPAPFVGLEGEGRMNVDPPALRAAYLAALRDHLESIVKVCRAFGFDYQRMDSHESVGPALAAVLARRNALARGGRAG
ncbi:MAG: DUF58 domain-containing protein [Phycisphaerae bacterium]|jgi:uncharacterized protein (DUF58 family)|nr:DUF58 domain-containing protein [Phycisphaerae bacterium]